MSCSELVDVDRQTVFDQDSEAWRRNMPPITRHGLRITRTKCLHDRRARKLERTQRKHNGMFQALFHLQSGRTYSPATLMKSVVINRPLNIKFPKGHLSLISGPTGSGKSALLNALLGGSLTGYRSQSNVLTRLPDRDDMFVRPCPTEQVRTPGRVLRTEPM